MNCCVWGGERMKRREERARGKERGEGGHPSNAIWLFHIHRSRDGNLNNRLMMLSVWLSSRIFYIRILLI